MYVRGLAWQIIRRAPTKGREQLKLAVICKEDRRHWHKSDLAENFWVCSKDFGAVLCKEIQGFGELWVQQGDPSSTRSSGVTQITEQEQVSAQTLPLHTAVSPRKESSGTGPSGRPSLWS